VSLVCIQVSRWAEARGAFATAMGYAQAAALALPLEAAPALAAGTLALRWGRNARAETWLRRTLALARRARQWEPYALACVELGGLFARRGDSAGAQRFHVQGLRASRRHGLIAVRGAALHGLLMLALEAGALDEAERYARGAMRAYGRGHPRLPELVHDVAYLWVRREAYGRAIPMLQKLLPTRVEAVDRALTLAILARAAAGAGDTRLYQEGWMDAWTVITRAPSEVGKHGRALLEMARGAALMRDWQHVEQAVRLASTAVPADAERAVARQVEELAAAVRLHKETI
jgi:tetratricopeptide (TPR) repeat protein